METLNLASCCLKDVQLSDRFFKFLVPSLSRAIFLMEQFYKILRGTITELIGFSNRNNFLLSEFWLDEQLASDKFI